MSDINLSNIYIEEFNKNDILKLKTWGPHEDLRYIQYAFDKFPDDNAFDRWYKVKTKKNKRVFAIKEADFLRGYISLRNINMFKRSSVMGISIDPNYLSCGIGKIALKKFLDMYFNELNMRTLNLKVSTFNKRAINLYTSLGFKHQKTRLERFENQMNNFDLLLHYDNFRQIGSAIYTEVSSYKISR